MPLVLAIDARRRSAPTATAPDRDLNGDSSDRMNDRLLFGVARNRISVRGEYLRVTLKPFVSGIVPVLACLCMSACASTDAASTGGTSAADRSPIATPLPPGTTTSAGLAADGLTGFGATDAAWESNHVRHPQYNNDAVYNPDPTLPTINGNTGAVYVEVDHANGRITGYTMNLHPTALVEATAVAKNEFPPDAQVLWTKKLSTCVQTEFASNQLGRALAGDPNGQVLVEFQDVATDGTYSANPSKVNQALFMLLPNPDPSFGC